MASYRLGTSAVQAFKMPWELNMTHTVTGNTPGEVKKKKTLTFLESQQVQEPTAKAAHQLF